MKLEKLSNLNKTWIFDLDGTLVIHNGYKNGGDVLLPGVKEFFNERISPNDYVLILTARSIEFKKETESFLLKNGIFYDRILYNLPVGERILFNDKKPKDDMITAYCFNLERNGGLS